MTNYATSLKGALIDVNLLSAASNLTDDQALERLLRIREIIETTVKLHATRAAERHYAERDAERLA